MTRRGHAKILDFGLAKVTGNTSESTGNTVTLDSDAQHFDESRSDAGTVAYMSVAAVDKIGKGRVWSGAQAKELGLVDELLLGQSGEVGIQRDSRDSLLQPM